VPDEADSWLEHGACLVECAQPMLHAPYTISCGPVFSDMEPQSQRCDRLKWRSWY